VLWRKIAVGHGGSLSRCVSILLVDGARRTLRHVSMTQMWVARRALAVLLLSIAAVASADQLVVGRKLLIKNPTGAESDRSVLILGRSYPSSVTLVGNPTVDGASLQVVANGANGTTQLLTLAAAGWTATSNGFRYIGPRPAIPCAA